MAKLITLQLEAPPDTVGVLVDFYDKHERTALLASPLAPILSNVPRTVAISTPDLCAYYLYYKKRLEVDGYSSHEDVAGKWHQALVEFDGQVEFSSSSLRLVSANNMSRGTTERLGEAIGLSVASELHGLHQADWGRIPEDNTRKTLDFQHPWAASDGRQFIEVEAKGSAAEDNDYKTPSVSAHKDSIKQKKAQASKTGQTRSHLYGVIGVLDARKTSTARCWLVDPPVESMSDPLRYKILTRLHYIAELIAFLGARSSLSASLQTRLASLRVIEDITRLNRVPLLRGNGTEYSVETFEFGMQHNPWFAGKSVVSDGPAGGQVFALDAARLMFIGMREQLLVFATQQDFSLVQEYAFPAATMQKRIECVVPVGRFRRDFEPLLDIPQGVSATSGGYVRFRLGGHLHYTRSGFVLGILPVPEKWQRR